LADPEFYQAGRIEMLLGSDARGAIIRAGTIVADSTENPYAELTAFGWVVSGVMQGGDNSCIASNHVNLLSITVAHHKSSKRQSAVDITGEVDHKKQKVL